MITDGFEKIIKHLQRKRGKIKYMSIESRDYDKVLYCEYFSFRLTVTLNLGEQYHIRLKDSLHIFKDEKRRCGTYVWETYVETQQDVIKYIRNKMKPILS